MKQTDFEIIINNKNKQKKKERIILSVVCLVLLFLLAIPIITAVKEQNAKAEKYNVGLTLIQTGNYADAKDVFESMDCTAYKDTQPLIGFCKACIYREQGLLYNARWASSNLNFQFLSQKEEQQIKSVVEQINAECYEYEQKIEKLWNSSKKEYIKKTSMN